MKRTASCSHSLFLKLALGVGSILFISMGFFSLFSIGYVKKNILTNVIAEVDRFSNTIKLGTHYSMMTNVREDITHIINNVARQENVEHIRIFHKGGHIVFSNKEEELGKTADITDYACTICHKSKPPPHALDLRFRTRVISSDGERRFLGIVNPIYNEPSCSAASCHAHSPDTTILGILDVVISLDHVDHEIVFLEKIYLGLTIASFVITSVLIFLFLNKFVSQPVKKMIAGTELIAKGELFDADTIERKDEMGLLASAISSMGEEIAIQQDKLKKTNDELILANKKLARLSTTDPLTGLANRRSLIDIFTAEFKRTKRYNHHLSILLIDVDFFKKVNDTHGHNCGDKVLINTSEVLSRNIRSSDMVSRYGGEEFIVLLPETDDEQAYVIAEKLRTEIAASEILCEDTSLSVTISIGIATYPEIDSTDPMQMINAADQALYKAKSSGRNQVVSFSAADSMCEEGGIH